MLTSSCSSNTRRFKAAFSVLSASSCAVLAGAAPPAPPTAAAGAAAKPGTSVPGAYTSKEVPAGWVFCSGRSSRMLPKPVTVRFSAVAPDPITTTEPFTVPAGANTSTLALPAGTGLSSFVDATGLGIGGAATASGCAVAAAAGGVPEKEKNDGRKELSAGGGVGAAAAAAICPRTGAAAPLAASSRRFSSSFSPRSRVSSAASTGAPAAVEDAAVGLGSWGAAARRLLRALFCSCGAASRR